MSFLAFDCACVVVNTKSRRKAFDKTPLLSAAAVALIASPVAYANPVGGAVTTGSASITASSNKTNVNQKSEDVVIDWSSFNIGSGQTTQFVQPNAQAIAVNRVGDANASQILGTLDANGRVVLINGNGVLFGKGSQVNVGSLIATSTDGSDSDVLSGKFTQAGKQNASVVNNGAITAASGGVVALVAPNVTNTGTVNAKLGTVALGAANKFTVDFAGDGLVSFAAQGDVNARASASNSGLLSGANVSMTAHAANGIATGIVNMSGIVTAQGVQNVGGTIVLDGGQGGSITVGGKLDASGAKGGGSITVGGWGDASAAVNKNAVLNASATTTGDGGHISVIAQKNSFAGSAEARGGVVSGDGGLIETSGHSLAFTGSQVDAGASVGKSGTWLLDPNDEIIDPTDAATVSNALKSESVELLTNATNCDSWGACVSGQGDIDIEGVITWNNSNSLTISAWHSINIMAPITATGPGSMTITYGHDGTGGSLNFGAPASGSGNIAFTDVSSGTTLGNLSIQGTNYVLVNSIGQLATDIGANANGDYALANSFDAGGTTYSGSPTGNGTFGGTFECLGNTISNLKISNSNGFDPNYGLFSDVSGTVADLALANVDFSITGANSNDGSVGAVAGELTGTLRNVAVTGVVDGNMNGGETGMLVGKMDSGQILNSMSAGTVAGGNTAVGGLTGSFGSGTIQGSFSTANISSSGYSGGIIGAMNGGNLADSYFAGSVHGSFAGGLAGFANNGAIATSYATGYVSGTTAGGLVGEDHGGNTYTHDVWDTQTTGQATSPGGTGETTAQLQAALPSGFSSSTWSILPGTSYSYLSWQFTGTPEVFSGTAYNGYGTNALSGGTVAVDIFGNSFATLTTGADGYFYDILPTGTIANGEALLAYTTGAHNGAHVESFSGNGTGFDIWGNTLIAPTSDTLYSVASNTSLQTQDSSLISDAVGSDSNAAFVTGLSNFGYVATGASFTVDQALSPANGLFVETRNGNLTVADPITLAGTNGLTLYSSNALTIDAPVNVTGAGAVALAAAYDTTTVPGTPLLELSFGLGSAGFAGSVNYGSTNNGGALTINGTPYTLLYSMSDVDSIDCSDNSSTCINPDAENLAGNYALAGSLDASGFGFQAIGAGLFVPFTGAFEGLGHTISNLSFDNLNPPAGQGLFSGSAGTIRDIGMVGGFVGGGGSNGFLIGVDSGVIENTFETGTVQSNTYVDPTAYSGGLVGEVTSTGVIANSFATGHITDIAGNTGGLVGNLQGTLVNDYATISVVGEVSGHGSVLGGLVGEAQSGSRIENSYATGAVAGAQNIGGLVGLNAGTITDSYAIGDVMGTTKVGGLIGANSGTISDGYWDTATSGQSSGIGSDSDSQAGNVVGLTTLQMQGTLANMPGLVGPTWATGAGMFPYLSWQFSGTPQVLSGTAYNGNGTNALGGGTVTVDANGSSLATLTTGANGYFYDLVAPGTFTTSEPLLAYTTRSNHGAHVEAFSGSATDFDIWGNTLIAPTSDTTYSTASGTSLQTQDASLVTAAIGSDSNAAFVTSLSNYGYVATGASFTINQPLTLSNGLYVKTTSGNITVDDALTLPGSEGLTLDSAGAFTVDAPISITGAGELVLDYSTASPANLSFGLTSSGFTGGVNYGSTNNGGTLTINGAAYTLLYSMSDVQNINNALTGNYALATSLDASSVSSWTPLGTDSRSQPLNSDNGFSGAFEGLGNTVSNLTVNIGGTNSYAGLFGLSAFGSIRDIGLPGISIVLGDHEFNAGLVALDGNATTASNGSTIADSYVTGSVGGFSAAGGLVGRDDGGAIYGSYATAAVNADRGAGGLVGQLQAGGTIAESYATGAVTGLVGAGGLVGEGSDAVISTSYAMGSVTVIDGGAGTAGGFIGGGGPMIISDSYATGAVNGGHGENIGGFAGLLGSGTITTSYSTGTVSGGTFVGGFVGEDLTTGGITNSYWDMDTSGYGASAGAGNISNDTGITGMHTAGLQGALPGGFLNATWSTGAGLYPYLSWQFNGTPQAISGTVFSGSTKIAGENVGLLIDGAAVTPAITEGSGADGYYYLLLSPGTISGSDVVTYLTSGTPANTFLQNATGTHGDVDLFENTFVAASSASDSAAILAELPTALGSASGSQFLYTASSGVVPGVNLVIVDTAPAFTLDSSLDVGNAILELYTTGSDTQTSGTITANQLISVSTGGLSLGGANAIANLGTVGNSGAGGISVTDNRALTVAGNLSTGTGDIDLTTTGTGNGIAIDDHLVGGTVDLVSAGTIRENGTNGFIHASVLEGTSDGNAFFNKANKIDAIDEFSTGGAGAFSLYDWKTLDETGLINTGKHSITLDTQIGDLQIGGALLGGTISLTSLAGEVDGGGIIDAKVLNVSANTGIDLYGTNNDIVTIGTDTTNSGPDVINQ